jgi:hypothetical protein
VEEVLLSVIDVCRVRAVRKIEIHTAEPLVPDPSSFEVEITIAKLKGINCQLVFKFQQEAKHGLRYINSLHLFGVRRNCLISRRSLL